MDTRICRGLMATFLLLLCGVIYASGFNNKHVLIIGIDGCRADALQMAQTPNIDEIIAKGVVTYTAHTGGELGTDSQQTTYSGPGWSSILTGVWHNKHGVYNNDFSNANYGHYPPLFARIKKANPQAELHSIVHWGPINTSILTDGDILAQTPRDFEVAYKATIDLKSKNPDVLFVHFDDVDGAGSTGFSKYNPIYLMAIGKTDYYIGQILKALKERPDYPNEDWLIIVTTDHGGYQRAHGGQTEGERTVFVIASGGDYTGGKVLKSTQGHTTVLPTVLKFFGIAIEGSWGLEETSLNIA